MQQHLPSMAVIELPEAAATSLNPAWKRRAKLKSVRQFDHPGVQEMDQF
jgi:hypothetical protein